MIICQKKEPMSSPIIDRKCIPTTALNPIGSLYRKSCKGCLSKKKWGLMTVWLWLIIKI